LLFEPIGRRYRNKNTGATTNKPFGQWYEVFPNAPCAVSLIDRPGHHCAVVAMEGDSAIARAEKLHHSEAESFSAVPERRVKTSWI
jgi:DNA replication protein DnaC